MVFKNIKKYLFFIIGGVFYSTFIAAQQKDSVIYRDFEYVSKSDVWLNAKNPAGLDNLKIDKLSEVFVTAQKEQGGFINYYQSENSFTSGIYTRSYYKLTPKVTFKGYASYQNFKGKNMYGSAFIDPYENPFDINEIDNVNRGTKQSENYNLIGATSIRLNNKWTVGGQIDYAVSNLAKMKDLRHINKLMDMNLLIGGIYQLNKKLEIGANYGYSRRIESIYFKTYGNIDATYKSLINFGAFYGENEVFSSEGYTASGETRPLTNFGHDGSLQLNLKIDKQRTFLSQFDLQEKKGYFGQEGTASVLYTTHNISKIGYKGIYAVNKGNRLSYLSLSAELKKLETYEKIWDEQTTAGGVTQVVYYGESQKLDAQYIHANIDYSLYLDIKNNIPKWHALASASFYNRMQTTNMYPFYRDQTFSSYRTSITGSRYFRKRKNIYEAKVSLDYGGGNGIPYTDGIYATPSTSQTAPDSANDLLYQEYDFFTANRATTNITFRYIKPINKNFSAFAKIDFQHTQAFNTYYTEKKHDLFKLTIGSSF